MNRLLVTLSIFLFCCLCCTSCDKSPEASTKSPPKKKGDETAKKKSEVPAGLKMNKSPEAPTKSPPKKKGDETAKKKSEVPAGLKMNQATATFQGKTLQGVEVMNGVKLSKYTMVNLRKGRINVMLAVPQIKNGTYETDKPGQGIALTLTGAGAPGKVSIRAMRKAKIVITKDGDVIEGTYDGMVAAAREKPISLSGKFLFERKKIK